MSVEIKIFEVGALQVNCSLIYDSNTKDAILVDPGDDGKMLLNFIEEKSLSLIAILHTHAHFDHIMGTHFIMTQKKEKKTSCVSDNIKIYLHENEKPIWKNMKKSADKFGIKTPDNSADITDYLSDNSIIKFNNIEFKVMYTPGHSPGSCCFLLNLPANKILFSGDTLFKTSIGRTDLWMGNFDDLMNSIKKKLFKLDGNTHVIPGHGPETTIAYEILNNPFIV